jgi:hypothetical protein
MELGPVGAELFTVNGPTDKHDEFNSRFPESYESDWKICCV